VPEAHGWHAGFHIVQRGSSLHSALLLRNMRLAVILPDLATARCAVSSPLEGDSLAPHAGELEAGPARARFFFVEMRTDRRWPRPRLARARFTLDPSRIGIDIL